MAKSRRKLKKEIQHEKEGKKLFKIVIVSTLVLMVLLFLLFTNNS